MDHLKKVIELLAQGYDRSDVVDELEHLQQQLNKAIDVALGSDNVAWDVADSLSGVEIGIKRTREMLDTIQKERNV